MKKEFINFAVKFSISLLLVFGIHVIILFLTNHPPNYKILISSYLLNYFLAIVIVGLIVFYIRKIKTYIGFLFMLGSFLKFAVFFIFFYPIFKLDGNIDKLEFTSFFIPYLVSLLFETRKLSSVLNNM